MDFCEGEVLDGLDTGVAVEVVTETRTDTFLAFLSVGDGVDIGGDMVVNMELSSVSPILEMGGLEGSMRMMLGVSWKTTCLLGVEDEDLLEMMEEELERRLSDVVEGMRREDGEEGEVALALCVKEMQTSPTLSWLHVRW